MLTEATKKMIRYAVQLYRQQNPRSRAVWGWVIQGGSKKKSAVCTFCRITIDTWSAEWPRPAHVDASVNEHMPKCALQYIANVEPETTFRHILGNDYEAGEIQPFS